MLLVVMFCCAHVCQYEALFTFQNSPKITGFDTFHYTDMSFWAWGHHITFLKSLEHFFTCVLCVCVLSKKSDMDFGLFLKKEYSTIYYLNNLPRYPELQKSRRGSWGECEWEPPLVWRPQRSHSAADGWVIGARVTTGLNSPSLKRLPSFDG